MSDHDDFMEGLRDASKLDPESVETLYMGWLASYSYSEVERIDLESGGYWAGLEVGHQLIQGIKE
jgi:hypothetical protein